MAKTLGFFVLLIMLLVLLNFTYAASFDVKVTPIKDKIVVDEVAEFEITIKNNLDNEEEFLIKKAGYPFWDMYTKPLVSPITINVRGQSSSSISLFVDPLYITSVDTYTLETGIVRQSTGEERKVPITVGIKSTEPLIGGYIPTVLASTSIPEEIDPREEFTITIALNNQNPINYSNLTIKVESNIFSDELHEALGPKEEKVIEVAKKIDALTLPQEDRLIIAIFKDQRLIVIPIVKEFKVKEYATHEELPKEQSFLKVRKGIRVVSNNPDYAGTAKIETTPFKNLLLATSPRAEKVRENGRLYLVWQIELDGKNSTAVYTTENYRPIAVIVALVIAALALYFVFRSPIVLRKGAANIRMSEGGISEAKIVVRVKNRSAEQITDLEVMDSLPHIAHVEREFSIGSMQPHAVLNHPKKGLIIKWKIEALEPGDERVLSYKLKSRLPILGELSLPAANARCKAKNNVVISNSNRVSVGG